MSNMGDEIPDGQGSFRAASSALARFTVLDLTRIRAGPTCVRQLGDRGADVIKIEMPETPECGEQTDEILADLGDAPEDIARPRDDDAI